jgi:hypothetical protein
MRPELTQRSIRVTDSDTTTVPVYRRSESAWRAVTAVTPAKERRVGIEAHWQRHQHWHLHAAVTGTASGTLTAGAIMMPVPVTAAAVGEICDN